MSATRRPRSVRLGLGRGLAGGRRPRLPRPGPRALLAAAILVVVLVGAFFWVRRSSLVAVRSVTITGVAGPDAAQIRTALTGAALGMSTMDVDARRLRAAVAPFSVVRSLRPHAEFPHGMRIAVEERIPVAVLVFGASRTIVATDGSLLRDARTTATLPTVAVAAAPGGTRVTGAARAVVGLLAAAPYALLSRLQSAQVTDAHGLTATLRDGPEIVFGADARLSAKWRSAIAVLASPASAGASYIDVTDPERPAAGAGSDAATTPDPPGETTPDSLSTTG